MAVKPKFDKEQIRAKFDIWIGHRSAEEYVFESGYDHFSIIPVVTK